MRRILINLFVALLTFAIGIAASALFYSAPAPAVNKIRREVVVEQRTATLVKAEPLSHPCGCQQGYKASEQALDESAPKAPISGGILNGKAQSLPAPPYPAIARAAHASGTVMVQVVVDERGCVTSSRAVSGHPLLQQAAVQAAYQACFAPTRLSGQPVKVTGVLSYNFVVQ